MEIPEPDTAAVRPEDFTGRFGFYDDGWPGVLSLSVAEGRDLRGTFHSYRLNADYEASAVVDRDEPHRIALTLHDFNGLDRQLFDGYLFTRGKRVITGVTAWKTLPFGFVARRGRPWYLSAFRWEDEEKSALPSDFLGSYSLYHDGGRGTLHLTDVHGRDLRGTWSRAGAGDVATFPVDAQVDPEVPVRVRMRLGGEPEAVLTGLMFSRPKNVVAGSISVGGRWSLGCYLVRYR